MKQCCVYLLGWGSLVAISCGTRDRPAASVHTSLRADACAKEADKRDPNETPYQRCPGTGSYALIVRLADSGRQSIDVVDAEKRVHPLDYQQFVTRHMCSLGDVAEWRMAKSGNATPAALIVRVDAREDLGNPEKATQSYYAVAKITPDSVCVTDRIPERAQTPEEVRRTADSAPRRPCARPLPPLTAGGETAR